jgi:hypothetical protein
VHLAPWTLGPRCVGTARAYCCSAQGASQLHHQPCVHRRAAEAAKRGPPATPAAASACSPAPAPRRMTRSAHAAIAGMVTERIQHSRRIRRRIVQICDRGVVVVACRAPRPRYQRPLEIFRGAREPAGPCPACRGGVRGSAAADYIICICPEFLYLDHSLKLYPLQQCRWSNEEQSRHQNERCQNE